jgi:hypothetical protein
MRECPDEASIDEFLVIVNFHKVIVGTRQLRSLLGICVAQGALTTPFPVPRY